MLKSVSLAFILIIVFIAKASSQMLSLDYYLEKGLKTSPLLKYCNNQISNE